jgi:DNA-directed RNA polymerase subunit RPC12/RpoP
MTHICPVCKKEVRKPKNQWKYGHFDVEFYICANCSTKFRDYSFEGKHSFTLQSKVGKRGKKGRGGLTKVSSA